MRMRCVLGRERSRCDGEAGSCDGEAIFPQWCYECSKPHASESELTEACLLAPTCGSCEQWLHDECGRAPGFVRGLAVRCGKTVGGYP